MKTFKYFNFLLVLFVAFSFFSIFTINSAKAVTLPAGCKQPAGVPCASADMELSSQYVFPGVSIAALGNIWLNDPGWGDVDMDVFIQGSSHTIIPTTTIHDDEHASGFFAVNAPSTVGSYGAVFSAFGFTDVSQTINYYVVAQPVINITMSNATIEQGGSSTISWTSTGATSCSSSPIVKTGLSNSFTASPNSTTTYTVTCLNSAGSVQNQVILTVIPSPVVLVYANPEETNNPGDSSNISWSSTGADSCNSGGHGTGTSGPIAPTTFTVNPMTTTTYSVTCLRNAISIPATCSGTYTITPGYCSRYHVPNETDYGECYPGNIPVTCDGTYGGFHHCQWVDSTEGQCSQFTSGSQCTSHTGCSWTPGTNVPAATASGTATVTVASPMNPTVHLYFGTNPQGDTNPINSGSQARVVLYSTDATECHLTSPASEMPRTGTLLNFLTKTKYEADSGEIYTAVCTNSTYNTTSVVSTPPGTQPDGDMLMVRSGPMADLTAGGISPSTAIRNIPRGLGALITNNGAVPTATDFPYFFQIKKPNHTDWEDLTPNGNTGRSPILNPQGSFTGTTSYTFDEFGTYTVRLCADKTTNAGGGEIDESDEEDNCGSDSSVVVPQNPPTSYIDLTASTATPLTAIVGTPVNFYSTISNQGTLPTSDDGFPFWSFFQVLVGLPSGGNGGGEYSFKDQIKDKLIPTAYAAAGGGGGQGQLIDLAPIQIQALPAIFGSATAQNSYVFTTAGIYSVRACADKINRNDAGSVTEMAGTVSYEGNNCSNWVQVTVSPNTGGGEKSDLTASSVFPNVAMLNQNTTFSANISNLGAVSTGAHFWNLFQVRTGSGTKVVANISEVELNPLSPGQSSIVSFTHKFTSGGAVDIRVCADKGLTLDHNDKINESNEYNNCGDWTTVTVGGGNSLGVSLFSDKTLITLPNDTVKLTWSTIGSPDSCTAESLPSLVSWTGSKDKTSGILHVQTISGLTTVGTYTFKITCNKVGSIPSSVDSTVAVSVIANPLDLIDVTLTAEPTSIAGNSGHVNVMWSTLGSPDSCVASTDPDQPAPNQQLWFGDKDVDGGSENVTLTAPGIYTFKIICSKYSLSDAIDIAMVPVGQGSHDGVCGTSHLSPNQCLIGTISGLQGNSSDGWTWICEGINGGVDSPTCSQAGTDQCLPGFANPPACDQCSNGVIGYPACDQCANGLTNYPACDQCATGLTNYPACDQCSNGGIYPGCASECPAGYTNFPFCNQCSNGGIYPDCTTGGGGTCSDKIKNGNEKGVDCGGRCLPTTCKRAPWWWER